jgi:hypothetical protein
MKVVTREIVESVTFSKNEIEAFKNLRDVMRECCDTHEDDCGECPFADHRCTGLETCDFLSNIINYFGDEDED